MVLRYGARQSQLQVQEQSRVHLIAPRNFLQVANGLFVTFGYSVASIRAVKRLTDRDGLFLPLTRRSLAAPQLHQTGLSPGPRSRNDPEFTHVGQTCPFAARLKCQIWRLPWPPASWPKQGRCRRRLDHVHADPDRRPPLACVNPRGDRRSIMKKKL